MEELRRLIAGSYGREDLIFAGHSNDTERAREAIVEAGKQAIGFTQYFNMHREYLQSMNCALEHIEEQLESVQDIGSYFDYD